MKLQTVMVVLVTGIFTGSCLAQANPPSPQEGKGPPPQAYADCQGKQAGDTVQHATREGAVTAACEASAQGLVARPIRPGGAGNAKDRSPQGPEVQERPTGKNGQRYSIEQAISDQAQLHTIAFNGLAFLTGDEGSATFIPQASLPGACK